MFIQWRYKLYFFIETKQACEERVIKSPERVAFCRYRKYLASELQILFFKFAQRTFFPKYTTALLRCSGAVCSCSSIASRYWGCLFVLSVSYLLFDLRSLSLVAYLVLFCCKNNLFEFCFLTCEDWWFGHPSLLCYCFSLCLVSYLVGICIAGVE